MNRQEYFEEFRPFFNAICVELERHDKEKGDTWKKPTFTRVKVVGGWTGPDTYTEPVMEEVDTDEVISDLIYEHYVKYGILEGEPAAAQEVDIAALLGMRWLQAPQGG